MGSRRAVTADGKDLGEFVDGPIASELLKFEQSGNPFLRADAPSVIAAARSREPSLADAPSPADVFAVIRRWKDRF